MGRVGSLLNWIGGGITRTAGTGLVTGLFLVIFGMTPGEAVAYVWHNPPLWLMSGWTRLIVLIVGLVIIGASLSFNRWSRKQIAIDSLAEDISDAIRDLVNWPREQKANEIDADYDLFFAAYNAWITKVSKKLENRAFFSRADQLLFDRLGYLEPVHMLGHPKMDWVHSMLKLKLERLREIINLSQERRR